MKKVVIYDGPMGGELIFEENKPSVQGADVQSIGFNKDTVEIVFKDGSAQLFNGFRYIISESDVNSQEGK